jgi:hypothetical protein
MDFDQESNLVLKVMLGEDKEWHVIVQDFHKPLASFDNPHSACAWAIARAKPKRGRVIVETIPVEWIDGGDSRFTPARDYPRLCI